MLAIWSTLGKLRDNNRFEANVKTRVPHDYLKHLLFSPIEFFLRVHPHLPSYSRMLFGRGDLKESSKFLFRMFRGMKKAKIVGKKLSYNYVFSQYL